MALKKEWQKFINELAKHGDRIRAYKSAYPNCKSDNAAAVNANKLLKNTNISNAVKELSSKIEETAQNKAIEDVSTKISTTLLDAAEKRSILAEIARGEKATIEEITITKDGEEIRSYRRPNANERIKAIDTDNKMSGDNAPKEINATVKSFSDFLKETSKPNES